MLTWLMANLKAASACVLSNASACWCILKASCCCEGCVDDISITEDLTASIFLILSIARIAFIALTDAERVSLVIGGVEGLLELLTWLAY